MFGSEIEDGTVSRDGIFQGLAEMPLLGSDRIGIIAVGQMFLWEERDLYRSGFPIVSVRMPIMLWKYTVVLNPPFHQIE